jgi:insertion element IS1 protein InsB
MPMRSAAACGGLSGPWVYPVRRSSPGEKKAASLPAVHETLLEPDGSEEAPILALDELWSDVAKKTHQAWIWMALCRKTRQVVAYAIGDRSETTCRWLWEAIASPYRPGHCCTDFWKANPRSDPRRPAERCGKRHGRNRPRGTLEPYDSRTVWPVLSAQRCPSPHRGRGTRFASTCFFIAPPMRVRSAWST